MAHSVNRVQQASLWRSRNEKGMRWAPFFVVVVVVYNLKFTSVVEPVSKYNERTLNAHRSNHFVCIQRVQSAPICPCQFSILKCLPFPKMLNYLQHLIFKTIRMIITLCICMLSIFRIIYFCFGLILLRSYHIGNSNSSE